MDIDLIGQLQTLVGARAAYPIVAVVLMLLTQLARKSPYTAAWWKRVPDGWRWVMPTVAGGAAGFIHGFQAGRPILGALIEMAFGIFGVSFTAMGLAATLRESPVRWDGGAGGKPPA